MSELDEKWMLVALAEAKKALDIDEVPIGACVINKDGKPLAAAFNRTISENDPTAHAEMIAIRDAAAQIGNYRLEGVTLYTTIEPCAMCAGALVNARVRRLVYGADDERFGAVRTNFGIGLSKILNHQIEVEAGVLSSESRALMQDFFRSKRAASKQS